MDPDAARDVGREPHGGAEDPRQLDFSASVNPRRPTGIGRIYSGTLSTARAYPADGYAEFRAAAATFCNCLTEYVVPTAGGMDAIRLAIETNVTRGDRVAVPEPSFAEFAREVRLQGAEPVFQPYDEMLQVDPADYAMVVLCNPVNPVGACYDPDQLQMFAGQCRADGTPLLVDEAFLDFTDQPSIAGEEGVIVARSLTKIFGLPGIRMGYAVATGEYYTAMENGRLAWNLSAPAAAIGEHCMDQEEFIAETRERVASERERMRTALEAEYRVMPSDAPYLLLEPRTGDVDTVIATAEEAGIAIRDARTFRGLDNHVRVAVRLPDENDRLLEALLDR
ncbi:MAG: aminotransferase class I/II-fold pyridoxal phosphate-dependent enzyme [Halobacteriales archaeon]|nr:aminotransferase class I/II-fold pyridoxal phosphate-dependent enzyme [Halobacteriales archaeon]